MKPICTLLCVTLKSGFSGFFLVGRDILIALARRWSDECSDINASQRRSMSVSVNGSASGPTGVLTATFSGSLGVVGDPLREIRGISRVVRRPATEGMTGRAGAAGAGVGDTFVGCSVAVTWARGESPVAFAAGLLNSAIGFSCPPASSPWSRGLVVGRV